MPGIIFSRAILAVPLVIGIIAGFAVNLAGLPGISIPCGFVSEGGKDLPVGLQLVGPHFGESRLLSVSHQFQQHTDWHRRMPAGYA